MFIAGNSVYHAQTLMIPFEIWTFLLAGMTRYPRLIFYKIWQHIWHEFFSLRSPGSFYEKWYLKTTIRMLVEFIATELFFVLQIISVARAKIYPDLNLRLQLHLDPQ